MQTIDTHAILIALLNLVIIYFMAAMLAVDGWVVYRLISGRPGLPPSPLLARGPVPWGAWTVLLMFLLSLGMPQGVFLAYVLANDLLPNPARAGAAAPAPAARVHASSPAPDEASGAPVHPAREPEAKSSARGGAAANASGLRRILRIACRLNSLRAQTRRRCGDARCRRCVPRSSNSCKRPGRP